MVGRTTGGLIVAALAAALAATAPAAAPESFPCLAHDAQHTGTADGAGPAALGTPRFVAVVPGMRMVGPATPVVADSKVFVYAECYDEAAQSYTDACVLAFDELDGTLLWSRAIEHRQFDSWSSPTAFFGDVGGETVETVLVGSGWRLTSLDAHDGAVLWSAALDHHAINASPIVADGRVFSSDSTRFLPGGKLYAYDVRDGALSWSREIGQTNGNTPAYAGGAVYVGTADGAVCSLDATDGSENWRKTFSLAAGEGFFGGLSVQNGAVYAATYCFYGGEDNTTLFKLNAASGAVIWTTAAERTDSIPVAAGGKVFLSGGVEGFGSKPKLQCFDDASGALLWSYDGAGGWTEQACHADGLLYVGLIPSGGYAFGPAGDLQVLDVGKQPGDPGFVLDVYGDAGSSPSVANGNVYTIGTLGDATALYAFGPSLQVAPCITDLVRAQPTPPQETFTITWTTRQGVTYVVQYSDGTVDGTYDPAASWTDIPESQVTELDGSPGDEGSESWSDDGTSSAGSSTTGSRFYRVRIVASG
jgi:outer membrane protein assembly factor BamB